MEDDLSGGAFSRTIVWDGNRQNPGGLLSMRESVRMDEKKDNEPAANELSEQLQQMTAQLINIKTGEFALNGGFVVSNQTTENDLTAHFGEERVSVRDFKNGHSNCSIRNLKLGELYFILSFYFLNGRITRTEILVNTEPYDDNAGWDSFDKEREIKKGKFIEQWMAGQKQGDDNLYPWGNVGLTYDFHNLCSSGVITYNPAQ
ncbi:MAG: hypothetical protein O9353_13120, partial [Bacteroidia bacterium]|nr:hypothetical protein [Bacteroidia bacterium]